MGQWTILERLLEASVHQHSTMIGRILLTVVGIFRILMVAIVGETVYEDEQSMFMCDTLQPGCNQACYDTTFPISHIRFWVFQIIMVCCPSLCFITYSVHQASKHRDRVCLGLDEDQNLDQSRKTNGILQHKGEEPDWTEVGGPRVRSKLRRQEGISRFYILQVVFRNFVEASFLLGQYVLFGWSVPAVLACGRYPCVKEVECYVSRPTEKTAFLLFMFAVSGFCVLLNLAELNHLGWTKVRGAIRGVRDRRKSLYEIRNKDPPTMSGNHYGHNRSSMNQFGQNRSRDSVYV